MTNYNDGKWHGWNGGECPVGSKSIIEYAWMDSRGARGFSGPCYAHEWNSNDERPAWGMIVAFRVIKEHKEPRDFWIDPDRQHVLTASANVNTSAYIHVREVLE